MGEILKDYPEVMLRKDSNLYKYCKAHPEVSGMAIGGGMNGIGGTRYVIINPFSKNINRDAVYANEALRHWMDENNVQIPITLQLLDKYNNTPYKGDSLNIGRTELARLLTGDKHLFDNKTASEYLKKYKPIYNKYTNPFRLVLPIYYKKGGKVRFAKDGEPLEIPSFEEWYKTVPEDRKDTTDYNLRRAYNLLPFSQLEKWRTATPEQLQKDEYHLGSVAYNKDKDYYEFLKSKNHKSYNSEIKLYNSPVNDNFREEWRLDDSSKYPRYVRKGSYKDFYKGFVLPEITITANYPAYDIAKKANPPFLSRIKDPNRKTIATWDDPEHNVYSHKMAYAQVGNKYYVYPMILEINEELHDFTNPKYHHKRWDALNNAIKNKNIIIYDKELDAVRFTEGYKDHYKNFK